MGAPKLPLDTSADADAMQVQRWRAMSPAQKAALVSALSRNVRDLALAGIRLRHPAASERECFLRFAALTLSVTLARRAYPELDDLVDLV
jgi:hypothetical protein